MKRYHFSVNINGDEWLLYYKGKISQVVVTTFSGLKLSIPARNFIPYGGFSGIQGTFEITFDESNRITSLHKL